MQQRAFQKLDSLRASWTGPIYEQVNEYIKNYSLENGYDYVLELRKWQCHVWKSNSQHYLRGN